MVLTSEELLGLLDKVLEDSRNYDPFTLYINPYQHKCILVTLNVASRFPQPTRKIRKVHMRRITARRKAMRAHLERVYEKQYGIKDMPR